ncbi:MAG: succinate dehydrogenase, cytochrome b556 subunit [Gammaproteobacteria bacterium]|nr:succinate dehydrogenase, cytochrome b556 subunit [Gammaproteobacteria bacterium]MBQ0839057.1 succinate dehydrogenase, cytochrome b556 subunit [Gammaproteobacteria bacterium]
MNDKRPVNLDIGTIQLPITAYVSILHRVSGVALFVISGLFIWMLDCSLASDESFTALQGILTHPLVKLVLWGMLAALAYHLVAGIRHMFMDFGVGETLEGGILGAKLVLVIAAILIAFAGAWVWL